MLTTCELLGSESVFHLKDDAGYGEVDFIIPVHHVFIRTGVCPLGPLDGRGAGHFW